MNDLILFNIKENVECLIRESVNEEIDKKVEQFRKQLEDRKDNYMHK